MMSMMRPLQHTIVAFQLHFVLIERTDWASVVLCDVRPFVTLLIVPAGFSGTVTEGKEAVGPANPTCSN